MIGFASKITYISTLTSTNPVQVSSGNSIKVYGFTISSSSTAGRDVTITNGADSADLVKVELLARSVFNCDIPFLADAGLRFESSNAPAGEISITVYHSQEGA